MKVVIPDIFGCSCDFDFTYTVQDLFPSSVDQDFLSPSREIHLNQMETFCGIDRLQFHSGFESDLVTGVLQEYRYDELVRYKICVFRAW